MATDPATEAAVAAALAAVPKGQAPGLGADAWEGRLPEALLHVWAEYGLVALAGGRLRLIRPEALAPILDHVLEGDPDLEGDTHAIALGDLGEVAVWSERHGFGLLTWPIPSLYMTYMFDPKPPRANAQIITELLKMPEAALEMHDEAQQPIHDRLVAALGALGAMQIYGATPVPADPFTPLEHYVIADAEEWLEAHYTETVAQLVDWERPHSPTLRNLGEPWGQGATRPPERRERLK